MCLVRAFREDRTLVAASDYIASTLGAQYVESMPAQMESVYNASKPRCPVVCLSSPVRILRSLLRSWQSGERSNVLVFQWAKGKKLLLDATWRRPQLKVIGCFYKTLIPVYPDLSEV